MLNKERKEEILEKAKIWFTETIIKNHIKNTEKLVNPTEFKINPFLNVYLANFLTGNSSPESIAKALIYPRVLGTSITTSFGQNIQSFTSDVLDVFGSTTSGIDIEFTDQIDGLKKYCQLKAGPNTINKDDVETIAGHFKGIISLGRTNNLKLGFDNMIVGVIYGEQSDLSSHYKRITKQYHFPVITGKDFWHRLTGDENFYQDLAKAIDEAITGSGYSKELEKVVNALANTEAIKKIK
ncbi:PmeII family type II restriction endonuclease [Pectobacterium carotovorum]|uniref:PmeII family type II restriction endonuclease n=1 Tax=Pectobacterium carotovorum TaxID=554 RepID=UPI0021169088|nr:PmeII family type II restriction endonuclease [Pectobacterium carotovorum]MCQ8234001.1 PmeII family type II restriction endonuclease [Pectobacterium carotovorum]